MTRPKGAKTPVCPGRRGGKGEIKKEGGKRSERERFTIVQQRAAVWTESEPWANLYAMFEVYQSAGVIVSIHY